MGKIQNEPQVARVTEYCPAWGGINCQGDCNITASGLPVTYHVTAACGPGIPLHSRAWVYFPFGVEMYVCQDRGSMIANREIDIATLPEDFGYRQGYFPVEFEFERVERVLGLVERGVIW